MEQSERPHSDGREGRKSTSERKRLANRENSRKSTGPKTERGKSYSRRNALKHAYFAKQIVVGLMEEEEEFVELRMNLVADLKPRTFSQQIAAEIAIQNFWRLRRAGRYEQAEIKRSVYQEVYRQVLERDNAVSFGPARVEMRKLALQLIRLLDRVDAEIQEHNVVSKELIKSAEDEFPHATELLDALRELSDNRFPSVEEAKKGIKAKLEAFAVIQKHRDAAKEGISTLDEHAEGERIASYDGQLVTPATVNAMRYAAIAERAYFRAVAELRRLQAEEDNDK